MQISKNILVAPLNWGLGHATRCIPIIEALLDNGDRPIIASDGDALELLKKEFPNLVAVELPAYDVAYAEKGENLKLKLLKDSPKIWNAIRLEHQLLQHLILEHDLHGVISDNRLGLYTRTIPCVVMSHQLQVLSGGTTWLSTQLHLHYIKKFDACWIPDHQTAPNLTGKLSLNTDPTLHKVYLGPISRFKKSNDAKVTYDLLILLSGPEPQRSILEKKLLRQIKDYQGKVLFVAGVIEPEQRVEIKGKVTYYNYLSTSGLQKAIERSKVVLCRSGYTSIMDLCELEKKAFLIPTPGQFEQEYLARHLKLQRVAPFATQDEFEIEMLEQVNDYEGLAKLQDDAASLAFLIELTFSKVNENSDPIPNSLST
ncbi:glycosyltransferase [Nonlabens sp. YIK11]|uniref:glycosyltransferase n=1 Tax=Nonlabens sp. YIK11 TaxID=1453349 RepID=UPI0006DC8809|nr:glycosyltransferase [Nonlabens sp. YIK11]KQC32625.1 glycosyltransferase [Nonlabens sp. YIK11]